MVRLNTVLQVSMVVSLATSLVLVVIGLALTSHSDLLEVPPNRKQTTSLASFITAGIHGVLFLGCGLYQYMLKRRERSLST